MTISQSMLKMFQRYLTGDDCGLQFEAKYITKTMPEEPTTEAQAGGHWFEFMCTGATPRNSGVIPQPVRIKSGDLNAMYRQLSDHIKTWESIKPVNARYGEVLRNETAVFGHTLEGITDAINDSLIGDIKTTSKIDDKWDQFGWGGEPEYLSLRPAMFQAKMYILLYYLNTGKVLPFWFWIFASNSDKAKQIKITMSESAVKSFLSEVEYLIQAIESEMGEFKAVTSFERCRDCPLECKFRQTTPDIVEIQY